MTSHKQASRSTKPGKAKSAQEEKQPGEKEPREKPPVRAAECRTYLRRRLIQEFPHIVDGFVKSAKRGSCQHVKLATDFLKPSPAVSRRRAAQRSLQGLLDKLEQSKAQER